MFNRRVIVVGVIAAGMILVIVVSLVVKPAGKKPAIQPTLNSISYTDAITGQNATDIVNENASAQQPNTIYTSQVTIDSIDTIYDFLTSDQALSVQATLNNFLMAHSGLMSVTAGIKNAQVSQTGTNQIQFVLVSLNPQASYQVTVQVTGQYQSVPDVTIKRIG